MIKLKGKVAVVTGGTSGIGKATAMEFVNQGARVIVTGRNQSKIDQTVAEIGGDITGFLADASKVEDSKKLAEYVKNNYGKVDIVFANAGLGTFLPLGSIDENHYTSQFDTLVKGVIFTVQEMAGIMNDGGSIVLNGSVVSEFGFAGGLVYSAAKGAVRTMVKTMAAELSGRMIRVNAVSPGPIDTNFFAAAGLSEEQIQGMAASMADQIPLKRFGKPSEVAKVVTFLASEDSSYIQGVNIPVDGGFQQI